MIVAVLKIYLENQHEYQATSFECFLNWIEWEQANTQNVESTLGNCGVICRY